MYDIPGTIRVVNVNPIANEKLLSIIKEYFKATPHIVYPLDDKLYVLPNSRTIDAVLNKLYKYFEYHLGVSIFRGAIHEYNAASHTYDISENSYYSGLPYYIRISELNEEKLKSFSED